MANERNYARFYTLLKKLPGADTETPVEQYTNGRTTPLRATTQQEYNKMCRDMEQVAGYDERMSDIRRELRRKRSVCLKLMQQLGIDTIDWDRVNAFCQDARIAGKLFRHISVDELNELAVKLRAIKRKRKNLPRPLRKEGRPKPGAVIMLSVDNSTEN